MIRFSRWKLALLGCAALCTGASAAGPTSSAFVRVGAIAAPDDRWDITAWDNAHHRLLVAHGKDLLVIEPANENKVRAVGSLAGAHGVAAVPGTDLVLVSSAKDDTVRLLDEESGAQVARIAVGKDPDAAIISRDGKQAFVMDADGGALSVIDLARRIETRQIPLKPGLEFAVQFGPTLVAVNNESQSEIEIAEIAAGKAAGSIALPGCEGPTGLAYDPSRGLALSACANGKAALVDLPKRRVVALVPIGLGPDTAIWDAAHHRFLVPCGKSGSLSIIRMEGNKPVVEPAVATETSARTAALDPASGRLYLPAASFSPAVPPAKRGALVPGSFHILVMAPAHD